MYISMDAVGPWSCLWYVALVLSGSFFLMNLLIAVLKNKFSAANQHMLQSIEAAEKRQRLETKQMASAGWNKAFLKINAVNRLNAGFGSGARSLRERAPTSTALFKTNSSALSSGQVRDAIGISDESTLTAANRSWGDFEYLIDTSTNSDTARKRVQGRFKQVLAITRISNISGTLDVSDFCFSQQSQTSSVRKWFRHVVVEKKTFDAFFMVLVAINCILLALVHHDMSDEFDQFLELGNAILTIAFTVELVIKSWALGIREYLEDGFNVLDFVIVTTSVAELALGDENLRTLNVVRAARLMRVMRVVKLIRYLPWFRAVIMAVLASLRVLVWITILLLLFLFIFTVMSIQLFGGQFDFPDGTPRANFDTFVEGFLTLFQVFTLYDWEIIMQNAVRAMDGAKWPAGFFVAIIITGVFVLMNVRLKIDELRLDYSVTPSPPAPPLPPACQGSGETPNACSPPLLTCRCSSSSFWKTFHYILTQLPIPTAPRQEG